MMAWSLSLVLACATVSPCPEYYPREREFQTRDDCVAAGHKEILGLGSTGIREIVCRASDGKVYREIGPWSAM